MSKISRLNSRRYRIPLDVKLSDSTHGVMEAFELLTVRVRDADGGEGVGYTYTTGRNGGAIADILSRETSELVAGEDADLIEHLWAKVWWGLHYGGRGGPSVLALSAFDIALWDLKARRAGLPLWKLLGGTRSRRALLCRWHRPRSLGQGADRRRPKATSPRAFAPSR